MTVGKTRASVELEVPFHDVDSLNVVWHGHYLKYLEIARTELLRTLGFEPRPGQAPPGKDAAGNSLRVVGAECRYIAPLHYGDRVKITAWVKETGPRIVVAYDVWNLTRNCQSARARTALVVVDREGALVGKLSDESMRKLES